MKEVGVGSQSGEWLTAHGFGFESKGFGGISKYHRDLVPAVPLKSLVVEAAIGQFPESDPAIGQGGTIRRMKIVEQHGGVEGRTWRSFGRAEGFKRRPGKSEALTPIG
jgi:hypothetical protein